MQVRQGGVSVLRCSATESQGVSVLYRFPNEGETAKPEPERLSGISQNPYQKACSLSPPPPQSCPEGVCQAAGCDKLNRCVIVGEKYQKQN